MTKLQVQIALSVMLASAVALVAALFVVWPGLRDRTIDQTEDALLAEARLVTRVVVEPLTRGAGPEVLDPLVDDTGRDAHSRITVIAPDGRVLADSSVSGPALLGLENHRHRPEVEEALATGTGSSVRHSATVEHDLVYTAVAVKSGNQTVGVVRVAREMDAVVAQAA